MENQTLTDKALALLRRFFGYTSFRDRQAEIISAVTSGRDCLVLMPTGGGKSICYQIPALLQPGVAVVVSPLIALMKDQVQALIACGIPAATINSTQSDEENLRIMESVGRGHIKLLYMSPERLLLDATRWPENMRISLFAIDEAHCISQWGHDFRPEYARLSILRELFPKVPVIALTATADRLTRDDIAARLALRNPAIFISSFDRPNIRLTARPNPGRETKLKMIGELIRRYADDSGIIYCLSRKSAEQTAAELKARGYSVAVYHAGLSPDERDRTQHDFIHGNVQVVCATVAFGMGINKSNIRFVVHNNLPRNIEGYYQEIGRAGRDGLPAEALLFYSFADIATLRSFIDEGERQMINMEKLTRMQEYAETSLCRRRVLLSYFSEHTDSDCGNCDVCLHPPTRFDGTIIAQKALSAIIRCQEKVGANMLIDILRGSARTDIISRGYDRIRTYGAGRDLPASEWRAYLLQMLQLGFIEIAYDRGNHLRVTPYGRSVLTGTTNVTLARFLHERHDTAPTGKTPKTARKTGRKTSAGYSAATTATNLADQALLKELKRLRMALAKIEGVPPYIIFNDRTLCEMAQTRPLTKDEFSSITGIGETKTEKYWKHFTRAIKKFSE